MILRASGNQIIFFLRHNNIYANLCSLKNNTHLGRQTAAPISISLSAAAPARPESADCVCVCVCVCVCEYICVNSSLCVCVCVFSVQLQTVPLCAHHDQTPRFLSCHDPETAIRPVCATLCRVQQTASPPDIITVRR